MEKSKPVLVDSNVWVGLYNDQDSLHQRAQSAFQQLQSNDTQVIVTNFIIQEVFNIISLRSSQDKALAFYHLITHHHLIDSVNIEDKIIACTIRMVMKRNWGKPLGLVDYSILWLSQEFDCEVISFDEQLMKFYQELHGED